MKLYLMRHGEALSSQQDPQRGLSEKGKQDVQRVAAYLAEQNIHVAHIFHSGKKRAQETAELVAAQIVPSLSTEKLDDITPNDDPVMVIDEIENWNEDSLIASHLPFIPNLITLFTGQDVFLSAISFETATVVCLEKTDQTNWKILWSTSPDELSRNASA